MLGRTGLLGCQLTWAAHLPHLLRRCGEPRTQWVGSGRAGELGHVSCAAESPGTELPWPLGGAQEHRVLGEERGAPPRGTAGPQTGGAHQKAGDPRDVPRIKSPRRQLYRGIPCRRQAQQGLLRCIPFSGSERRQRSPQMYNPPCPLDAERARGYCRGG